MSPDLVTLIPALLASPLTATATIAFLALLVAVWVPGRLRRLGFQPGRLDSELDWPGIIGLMLGLLGLLLGLSGLAVAAELTAVSTLLGDLFHTLLTLAPALAILAGSGHAVAARRGAVLSRKDKDQAHSEGQWIQRGALLIAALTLVEMSLSLPAIVLITAAIGLWLYRTPAVRKRMESGWKELKAGQQLRSHSLAAGDIVSDLLLAGPVGLFDTQIDGKKEPVSNSEILEKLTTNTG